MTNKVLRIATWNANGLLNHKQEVITFININKIDILLVSETHFTDLSYFSIPNYTTYTTTHPDGTAHGGTAIIIKNSISHYELEKHQTNEIQATSVNINTDNRNINVTAVYCPPRHTISVDNYKQFFRSLGNRFIAGGDWNAKHTHWGVKIDNHKRT